MARGKKSSGKHYTSKGERRNVAKWVTKANRREYLANGLEVNLNKQEAWRLGKKVFLTIKNPAATKGSNRPFIRVPANEVWGNPNSRYIMKNNEG